MTRYLTSDEAALLLGVSRQTLYAYVSRGLLTAHQTGDDPRRSLYLGEAVERLAEERRRGRRPKEVARSALDWGVPALESAITLIDRGRLFYRGEDAVALAASAGIEEIAALLWGCRADQAFTERPPAMGAAYAALLPFHAETPPAESLPALLLAAAGDDETAMWRRGRGDFFESCGGLVRQLFAVAVRSAGSSAPLHRQLAEAWGLDDQGADLLRMALVLCADHELNASSFTARCIASTGASLRASVLGGLAALSGGLHGAATMRVETFWRGLGAGGHADALKQRLAWGEDIPGLGHPLYPEGDVRAKALLQRILPDFPESAALMRAIQELTGRQPSIDFALVVLRRHLNLPEGSAFAIFALGRSVGWIAHALEQAERGQLIRPRAVYTGLEPAAWQGAGVAVRNPDP